MLITSCEHIRTAESFIDALVEAILHFVEHAADGDSEAIVHVADDVA